MRLMRVALPVYTGKSTNGTFEVEVYTEMSVQEALLNGNFSNFIRDLIRIQFEGEYFEKLNVCVLLAQRKQRNFCVLHLFVLIGIKNLAFRLN